MKRFLISALALLASLAGQSAGSANLIYLDPSDARGFEGDVFSIDLYMDFDTRTKGMGSTSITYDESLFGNVSFAYDDVFKSEVGSVVPINYDVGEVSSIGFIVSQGIIGSHKIGTLFLEAQSPGETEISLVQVLPLLSKTDNGFGAPIMVNYSGATVSIATVPVPAAFWLMASGLGLLAGWRRRG